MSHRHPTNPSRCAAPFATSPTRAPVSMSSVRLTDRVLLGCVCHLGWLLGRSINSAPSSHSGAFATWRTVGSCVHTHWSPCHRHVCSLHCATVPSHVRAVSQVTYGAVCVCLCGACAGYREPAPARVTSTYWWTWLLQHQHRSSQQQHAQLPVGQAGTCYSRRGESRLALTLFPPSSLTWP